MPSGKKVYLGMSGGVDSSVSALLLKDQGYDVTGVYMKNWSEDLPGMKCPWAEDLADAKRVAVQQDLNFEVWDYEQEYKAAVVDYMLGEFQKGRTPNPDVICNELIKFKLFYERALARGADFIATGHYARVITQQEGAGHYASVTTQTASLGRACAAGHKDSARAARSVPEGHGAASALLARAYDENKDQTYFLYRISKEALAHTLFPIGEMKKPEVKALAAARGLDVATKKESMGICFVGEVGMKDFLQGYLKTQPGEIREAETEKVLGYHDGAIFYTLGQRHGLYLGGGLPYYVVAKDLKQNIVYVSRDLNHPSLWAKELQLTDVHWLTQAPAGGLTVRLRHRGPLIPVTLSGSTLIFAAPVKRPAPGQSAVLYSGEICLGGGVVV